MNSQKIGELLIQESYRFSNVLGVYLDHWLHLLKIEHLDIVDDKIIELVRQSFKLYLSLCSDRKGNATDWADVIGDIFEQCKGKGNKQSFGQFFTPKHVCDLMSKLVGGSNSTKLSDGRILCYDPTAGSSRTLMSAHWNAIKDKDFSTYPHRQYFYCANDLDPLCFKMSVINFFLHGMSGEITHGNGLWLEKEFFGGYRIEHIPIKEVLDKNIQKYYEYRFTCIFKKEKPLKLQDIFNYHWQEDIWYCMKDGTTVISMPYDNHLRLVKKITKEESFQVASELAMMNKNKKQKEEQTGVGLFSNVKNKDVIQVKKASTTLTKKISKPSAIQTPKSIGEQLFLF